MNALQHLLVYRYQGAWVFDFLAKGLDKEPLVAGIDKMLDLLADGRTHVLVTFSHLPFPGCLTLKWVRADMGGNWYRSDKPRRMVGWLCPALLKFFPFPPARLYVKVGEDDLLAGEPVGA